MFGLVNLMLGCGRGAGGGCQVTSILFLSISSNCINLRLHTENQLCKLPGSALKVCVVGGTHGDKYGTREIWWWG